MNTYTSGGDMGSHTWAPWYMKHHLLPHGRFSGWAPDWYDGFPAFTFYFPFPAILIVLLSFLIPYAVAFKLGTVAGVVGMPIAAWAYGRLARLPFPVPACLAAATLPFLFDTGFTIFGGNIASTLAGEYMFSVGLSLSLVFLGLVTGGLDTNKRRAWAAILFAAIILSHVLIAIFALTAGLAARHHAIDYRRRPSSLQRALSQASQALFLRLASASDHWRCLGGCSVA